MWQIINYENSSTDFGITANGLTQCNQDIHVSFYDKNGLLSEHDYNLKNNTSLTFNTIDDKELICGGVKTAGENIWYTIKSEMRDLSAFSVTKNNNSGYLTGEHNF